MEQNRSYLQQRQAYILVNHEVVLSTTMWDATGKNWLPAANLKNGRALAPLKKAV
jgi:hypothetical protein